ncbi:hypothetical protein M9H77_27274 [Catharanthus roseus]|uniref:Uncharacterized protein n=1 Tax=Catharanthus roseus TaxID=4058 RepID=A0ACC0ACK6_CATRO|nr:hypothetical protein M9H77_27274 [Catharanthus roseus]
MNRAKLNFVRSPLEQLTNTTITINFSILETLLPKCINFKQFGQIVSQIIVTGFIKDTHAASRIVEYSTGYSYVHIDYCRRIFNHIEFPNVFTWNTMMKAYVKRNRPHDAILLYKTMLQNNEFADNHTYPRLVQACALRAMEFEGREFHNHAIKVGFENDVYVCNTLINMYAVCKNLGDARRLFDESLDRDSVSWNSILAGYIQIGNIKEAKLIYDQMPERNAITTNSMIAFLGRCGRVSEAYHLFTQILDKELVSWTAMISCYENNGMHEEALKLFVQMRAKGIAVDEVVMVTVLSACAKSTATQTGEFAHALVIRAGFESYVNLQNVLIHMYSSCGNLVSAQKLFDLSCYLDQVSWNSMLSCYFRCGEVEKANALFDAMPEKDVVSWSAMISGYVQLGSFLETLDLFQEMLLQDVKPDETTLVSVISACTHLSALDQGRWLHAYLKKYGFKENVILYTTLIDMYMKCGCVENAMDVFSGMEEKGVSTWNAVILGLAMNGQVARSLEIFQAMKRNQIIPNEVTFVAVLGACRHMGLVDEGRSYFDSMTKEYNIEPNVKHYGCMVDLLGRAGQLKEAENLINSMPMAPDVATWGALLGACRKHGDNEMGERVGRKLIELQPDHDGFHVLLSNIYASKGDWHDVMEIRGTMTHQGVVKTPGCSMIEANGAVHEFFAGDRSHPQMEEIEAMLAEMAKRLKMLGYAPEMCEVFFDIDEEEKESVLFRHSEKLALAFGLFATKPPMPIRIMKNLRICGDCHEAAKLISIAFYREIVIRDRHRFHHFKDGSCSCMGYW